MEKLIPQLRFTEFKGEWETKLVQEICNVTTGNKDTQNKVLDGLYPFFVRSDNVERINSYSFDGEAVLTSGDGVGVGKNFHYIKGKFDYHQRVYCMNGFKNCNGKYFYYYFSMNFYNRAMRMTAKNSVDSVRRDMITKMPISTPSLEEQTKIANFLGKVDKQIELLTTKKEKLEAYKKGIMQQLFNQELRFKKEDGTNYPDWEEKKLGEISKIYDGTHQTPHYVSEGIPFYSVEHISSNNFNDTKFIEEAVYLKEIKRCKIEEGDVLMTRIGSIGVAKYINWNPKASFYVSLALLKPIKEIIKGNFLAHYINGTVFQKEIWGKSIHVAFPKKINLGDILKCKLLFPCFEEQTKIANFLSAIDRQIEQVDKQINKSKTFKKGLLQQMFV